MVVVVNISEQLDFFCCSRDQVYVLALHVASVRVNARIVLALQDVVLHFGVNPLNHRLSLVDFGFSFERFQVHVEFFSLRNRVNVDVGLQSHTYLLLLNLEVIA